MTQEQIRILRDRMPGVYDTLVNEVYSDGVEEMGLEKMLGESPNEVFDAWLKWEGIIGYTYSIISMVTVLGIGK